MKKVVFFVILAVQLGVVLVFALFGARITYDRAIPVNWDAISACAGWAAVVVSGLAIYYAIQVPKKIAEEQNKIALFEKRYSFYINLCKIISFAHALESIPIRTQDEAVRLFYNMFTDSTEEQNEKMVRVSAIHIQYGIVANLGQAEYLFHLASDKPIEKLLDDVIALLSSNRTGKEFLTCCENLKTSTAKVQETLIPIIEEQLKLGN